MNLPSNHQAQAKDGSTPAGENDHSLQAKIVSQPTPWKSFLALGVVSVGLHLLALKIPLPAMQPISKINQPIKVTRLAVAPKPKRQRPKSIPKPTLSPLSAKPKPVQSSSQLQNRAVDRAALASPRPSTPAPVAFASPKSSDIPSPPSSTPSSPPSIPPSSPSPAPEESQKSTSDFDLPPYPGASFDFKILALSTKDDFKMVVDHFDKSLLGAEQQKWHSQVIADEPNRKVYQVSKGDATRFLSVFVKGPLTAYVLADKPTNDEALEQAKQAITRFGTP
jgi:hypothetical protein